MRNQDRMTNSKREKETPHLTPRQIALTKRAEKGGKWTQNPLLRHIIGTAATKSKKKESERSKI